MIGWPIVLNFGAQQDVGNASFKGQEFRTRKLRYFKKRTTKILIFIQLKALICYDNIFQVQFFCFYIEYEQFFSILL